MLVFWRERLALLAVPKTGTTALEGALAPRASLVLRDPPQLKHAPLYRFRRLVEPLLAAGGPGPFETVAVVREPLDWLGSWWRYRSRPDLDGRPNSTRDVSFDDFVAEFCRPKPRPFASVGSQARFVLDEGGAVGVTHLFRYEAPEPFHRFLSERLGVALDLPRLNVSPARKGTASEAAAAHLRRERPDEFRAWDAARAG